MQGDHEDGPPFNLNPRSDQGRSDAMPVTANVSRHWTLHSFNAEPRESVPLSRGTAEERSSDAGGSRSQGA